jgi:lipopolysaccharide export system permease protein
MKAKILDIYITKKFIGTLGFILLMTAIVSSIFDVADKMDAIIEHNIPLHEVLWFYVNFVPSVINLTSPILIFISTLLFTARMANNTEVIAILGTGVSYRRFIRPYIIVGIVLASVDFTLKNYVLPLAVSETVAFEGKYLHEWENYNAVNIHRRIDENTFFYAQSVDVKSYYVRKFSIEKFNDSKLTYKLISNDAYFDTLKGNWRLAGFFLREITDRGEKITHGDSMRVKIPITIADFGQKKRTTPTLTTPELNRFIRSEKKKGETLVKFYLVERHRRIATPFAIVIMVIIAVSLASKKVRGGMGIHLLLGILIAASYELFMRFSTTFATNADLPPLIAVWIPNIIYMGLALFLVKRAQK